MKTEIWYILHLETIGFLDVISTKRKWVIDNAKDKFSTSWEQKSTWKELQKRGFSVQKVKVVPILKKGKK